MSTAATDAGIQYYETGTVNPEQVVLSTATQLAVATSAEAGAAVSQKTAAYNNKINEQRMQADKIQPETAKKIKGMIDQIETSKEAIARGRYVGEDKIHKLGGSRKGQIGKNFFKYKNEFVIKLAFSNSGGYWSS